MLGRGYGALWITLAMAASLLLAAPAQAAWTSPLEISPASGTSGGPQVAVDAHGNAIFVWGRRVGTDMRVQTRVLAADGTLSPIQTLSESSGNRYPMVPEVAVDPAGDSVFVWRRFNGTRYVLESRARSADGTLSPVQTVAVDPSFDGAQVAVDRSGNAVFVWEGDAGIHGFRIQARARAADGTLSPVQDLSRTGAADPEIAVDDTGQAVFVWDTNVAAHGGQANQVQTRTRSPSGSLSPVSNVAQVIDTTPPFYFSELDPQVDVDPSGDAVFVWTFLNRTHRRVQTRARAATGAYSALQTLAGPEAFDPQVAVNPMGNAVVAWRASVGRGDVVQGRARAASGVLSPIQPISGDLPGFDPPQVAVDGAGTAVFVWDVTDATHNLLRARTRLPDGTLGALQTLSRGRQAVHSPQVDLTSDGQAVAVWRNGDRIQAASGP
jgi:hypothetical protein